MTLKLPPHPLITHPSPPSGITISGAHAVARYLCRLAPKGCATPLYGGTNLEKAEIDHWLEYSVTALSQHQSATLGSALERLDLVLGPRVYLVGYDMTLADLAVYSAVRGKGLNVRRGAIKLVVYGDHQQPTGCIGEVT